jgi:hypothetical protein
VNRVPTDSLSYALDISLGNPPSPLAIFDERLQLAIHLHGPSCLPALTPMPLPRRSGPPAPCAASSSSLRCFHAVSSLRVCVGSCDQLQRRRAAKGSQCPCGKLQELCAVLPMAMANCSGASRGSRRPWPATALRFGAC